MCIGFGSSSPWQDRCCYILVYDGSWTDEWGAHPDAPVGVALASDLNTLIFLSEGVLCNDGQDSGNWRVWVPVLGDRKSVV